MALVSTCNLSSLSNALFFKAMTKEMVSCISKGDIPTLRSLIAEIKDIEESSKSLPMELKNLACFFDIGPLKDITNLEIEHYYEDFEFEDYLFYDKRPMTLLEIACLQSGLKSFTRHEKAFEMIQFLVDEIGFDVNRCNSITGKTPLFEMGMNISFSFNYYPNAFFFFLERGARISENSNEKAKFIDKILYFKHDNIEEYFKNQELILEKCIDIGIVTLPHALFKYCATNLVPRKKPGLNSNIEFEFNVPLYEMLKRKGADVSLCKDPLAALYIKAHLDIYVEIKKRGGPFRPPNVDVLFMLQDDGFYWNTRIEEPASTTTDMYLNVELFPEYDLEPDERKELTKVILQVIKFLHPR